MLAYQDLAIKPTADHGQGERTTEGQVNVSSEVGIETDLWWAWAEIAGEQERHAERWRRSAHGAMNAGASPAHAIAQETKAAMAAFVATAAAFETMGRSLR